MGAGRRCPKCPTIITNGARYCPTHMREYETQRGTAHARGYDTAHRAVRARWQARINQGHTIRCVTCPTLITPGMSWDLGHDHTNGGHLGPQCWPCNRGDGGRRGAQATNNQR